MYDLIGDIHGYADDLEALLRQLGYTETGGAYRHPERKVIFLGDFVDRGPKILRVLEIARRMVDAGHALAVLGNHEMNALAFATPDSTAPGKFLRRHFGRNITQHQATLDQLAPNVRDDYWRWLRTLPVTLDLPGLRVVHACWDDDHVQALQAALTREGHISDAFLHDAYRKEGPLYDAVEAVLKGKEAILPEGVFFEDAEGNQRTAIRTRWYLPLEGQTFANYAWQHEPVACDLPLSPEVLAVARPYPTDAKPLFIGHYWLKAATPHLLTPNLACLDFSVAKGGYLCAYRWHGETTLTPAHFVWHQR